MKRILFSLSFLVLALTGSAQSMSDSQVLQYVQREMKAGTSQSQIVVKLMQKGATVQQIQRLRNQYEKAGGSVSDLDGASASSSSLLKGFSSSRSSAATSTALRQNNGSVMVDDEGNPLYSSTNGFMSTSMSDLDSRPNVYIPDMVDNTVNGKPVFGRDIFNKRTLSFEPNMNIATPTNYIIGPGDQIVIDVYGASQKSETLSVSPEGTVTVTGYGPIQVAGLTVAAAQAKIRQQLGQRYSSSKIRLTVGQTRTIQVNVMGEVAAPGTYTLSAFASVFHALYMAGGVNAIGTLRSIKVYRGGRQLTVVDVYDYILNGRLTGNVRLADNDVIVVGPYDCIVEVAGKVKRPMLYEMKKGESVASLIKYAGGFTGDAYTKAVQLNRTSGDKHSGYNIQEFDMTTFKVQDGDSVTVSSTPLRYENTVTVTGDVFYPGNYDLSNGVNTVRSLIEAAGGLNEYAFTGRAVIRRMNADRTRRTISVDLDGIMSGTTADIPLENEDELIIASNAQRTGAYTVAIRGEVYQGGELEYSADETIEDLIVRAGGLTDAASMAQVDVARRIVDPKATGQSKEIAKTYTFQLKDGLVVDGDRSFTLQPYDVVTVHRSPGYQIQREVSIDGEVLFRGSYTMTHKNQRISEIVKAAGGVTDEAYLRGARIERLMTEAEKFRNKQVLKLVEQQKENMGFEEEQIDSAEVRYSVGIELDKALANPGSDYDVVLREGDKIIIPEYNGTVKINGNVMFPNTVAFSTGKSWKWYVNQGGGFGAHSKKSRTFIVYANGMVSKASKGKVEPGCEIIVPSRTTTPQETLSTITGMATSLATMVTMIATVTNLIK